MSPQGLAPLPLKTDDDRDDVEELVTTPNYANLGQDCMAIASEFGQLTGRRLSVAPSPGGEGDDLPGAKARRVLGIKTSSGFEDCEFNERNGSNYSLPLRSPSPSFMSAVSSVMRRRSTKTPSLISSSTTDDEWEYGSSGTGSSSTRSSADLGTSSGPPRRRPSISNIFGRSAPREQAVRQQQQRQPSAHKRSNSEVISNHAPLPHYRKAKNVDTRAAISAGWMRGTEEHSNTIKRAKPSSLTVDCRVHSTLAPAPSPALAFELDSTAEGDDDEQFNSPDYAVFEHLYKALPSVPGGMKARPDNEFSTLDSAQWNGDRGTPSPEDWSHASSSYSSGMPSLIGHGSRRCESPYSIWSCATGSSMSLDAVLGRSTDERKVSPVLSATTAKVLPPAPTHGQLDLPPPALASFETPIRESSLREPGGPSRKQASKPSAMGIADDHPPRSSANGCSVAAPVPLINWSKANHRHGVMGQPRAGKSVNDEAPAAAFVTPRPAPRPPQRRYLLTKGSSKDDLNPGQQKERVVQSQSGSHTLDNDDDEEEDVDLWTSQRTAEPVKVCDEIFFVTRDERGYSESISPAHTDSSLVPSYYLRSPSADSQDDDVSTAQASEEERRKGDERGDEGDGDEDDERVRAVLRADSPDKLRDALAANGKMAITVDRPLMPRLVTEPAAATAPARPSVAPLQERFRSSAGPALPHRSLTVPVDEEAEQEVISFIADPAQAHPIDFECPDARRSIEDALDSIILDLPSRLTYPSSPLKINTSKKASIALPPKSPLRHKERYCLPIM